MKACHKCYRCHDECLKSRKCADYWQRRCLAAEKYIAESPCDPDILSDQIKAHEEWQKIKAEFDR